LANVSDVWYIEQQIDTIEGLRSQNDLAILEDTERSRKTGRCVE